MNPESNPWLIADGQLDEEKSMEFDEGWSENAVEDWLREV